MKTKRMSEREVWRLIARAFERDSANPIPYVHDHVTFSGLCNAYQRVTGSDALYYYHKWDTAENELGAFIFPLRTQEGSDMRCLLACLFSVMTTAERKQIGLPR